MHHPSILRFCLLTVLGLMLSQTSQAQKIPNADSLLNIISRPVHDTVRAEVLSKLSVIARMKSQFDRADSLSMLAIEAAVRAGSAKFEAESRINLGHTAQKRGEFRRALAMHAEIEALLKKGGTERQWGNLETLMGNCHSKLGNLSAALECHQKSLSHFEKSNDKRGIKSSMNNIAIVYANQKRLEKALEIFKGITAFDLAAKDTFALASDLRNEALCLIEMKRQTEALPLLDSARTLYARNGNLAGVAESNGAIGVVLYETGNYEKAHPHFEEEIRVYTQLGKKHDLGGGYINLGRNAIRLRRFDVAEKSIRQGLEIVRPLGHKEYISIGYLSLAQLDSARNNLRSAFEHFKMYKLYEDSILNETTTEQLAEMDARFESERKEQEIELLNKDSQIQQKEIAKQKLVRNGFVGGFALMLAFAAIFFVQRNRIQKEKDRSEELLLNILPYETAQELKTKGTADAQHIDEVTVLFTDFKGFTQLSEKLSPKELVAEINDCFSEFDRICERHGIEKIKTIGDAYMAAGGLPTANHTHAVDVVKAACEIRDFMNRRYNSVANQLSVENRFQVRIGVHTGPVVAGIVGLKKFQYDIWGDTVNTANRMETSGEVGMVNISQSTYELVKDRFSCTYRGEVEAKGKGMLKMYFVA
jgi:class 3 adenylate cyclase